jgi:hypothetical protein
MPIAFWFVTLSSQPRPVRAVWTVTYTNHTVLIVRVDHRADIYLGAEISDKNAERGRPVRGLIAGAGSACYPGTCIRAG